MIWIIGGTSDSNNLSRMLISDGFRVLVSVTTKYGNNLATETGAVVTEGALNREGMLNLINKYRINMVIDASHPFAGEVSENAIAVTSKEQIPYLRYERPLKHYEHAIYTEGYDGAVCYLASAKGNILLTTGSKQVHKFMVLGSDRVYARVLSTSDSLLQCEEAGLAPGHIIATKGISSVAFNLALIKEYRICHLVTKDSGDQGGMDQKMEAAALAGIPAVVISRPKIYYPEIFWDYGSLLNRIQMELSFKKYTEVLK